MNGGRGLATHAIRRLERADAAEYHAFRLAQLEAAPMAFTATPQEERSQPLAWVEERLHSPDRPMDFVLGAFDHRGGLVGTAGLSVFQQRQTRHKALLFGMAVDRAAAGAGLGRALVRRVVEEAGAIEGLLQIVLTLTDGNDRAERLYRSCGFRRFGVEPRAVLVAGCPVAKVHMALMLDGLPATVTEDCGIRRGKVIALARDDAHRFSKRTAASISLAAGLGVDGDVHQGETVRHRSRVAIDPTQPNLRQVHLIHAELLDELGAKKFDLGPGDLGENVTTRGVDLLGLPRGALLEIGEGVVLEVTGLRNPCAQIERLRQGLLAAVLDRGPHGEVIRKAGVMAVVRRGGILRPGDAIDVILPAPPHLPLEPV